MLKTLNLNNVGPATAMQLDFRPRLNLITGDNGLGKSFLLDIAWWALTGKWPAEVNPKLLAGKKALPRNADGPQIGYSIAHRLGLAAFFEETGVTGFAASFSFADQEWSTPGVGVNQSLVLYAMGDGSFAVWDPIRNGGRDIAKRDGTERPPYVFSPAEVWDGLQNIKGTFLCNGLIRDWASWQRENGPTFQSLCAVLKALSASENELLIPGALKRISLDDARDIPSIRMPYGEDVPVLHASSGMRRIIALAYLLVWAQAEHASAAGITLQASGKQILFLIDEVESHLHPKWQRRIVPALLDVMQTLDAATEVQALIVTHSPMVMASVEPYFDEQRDAWFDLDFKPDASGQPGVMLEHRPFVRRGDAASWLTSPAFDLPMARSIESEHALQQAAIAMSDENFTPEAAQALRARLHGLLAAALPSTLASTPDCRADFR